MKKIYLLFLFCIACTAGYAQTAASYAFSTQSGIYASIADSTGTVSISDSGMASNDSFTLAIPLGFTFKFCGAPYTTCSGDANGVLSLAGNDASSSPDSTHITGPGWLMPLWYDLYGVGRTAYYRTTGAIGSRVFTLEWHNWSLFGDSTTEAIDTLNFQVKLYEGTNVVQFVYGGSVLSGSVAAAIGIANSTTDLQTLPGIGAPATDTTFDHTISSEPNSGTVLQWCPPLAAPASITGITAVCAGSVTTLADATTGGTWSSNNTFAATVGATGVVTGIAPGTATFVQTAMITYTITNACAVTASATTTVTVNPLPGNHTVSGGGTFCAGTNTPVTLSGSNPGIMYQLYHNGAAIGSAVAGNESPLTFSADTLPGNYTVVATDTTTGCTSNMTDTAVVIINPLPAAYPIFGGTFCASPDIHVIQFSSDTGVNYQLYNGAMAIDTPLAGTGGPLVFARDSAAGTFTVIATNRTTGCMANMADSAVVVINPLPPVHTVSGSDVFCAGSSFPVSLSGSDTGISYQLYRNGTAIGSAEAGNESFLIFTEDTISGAYTIIATDTATRCTSNMMDTAFVTVNALPVYTVTGGGSYCSGGAGVHVRLSASDTAVLYYLLYNGSTIADSPGTGAAIDYGAQTAAGIYTVIASSTITGCDRAMADTAVVVINPLPPVHTVTTPGLSSYCAGSTGIPVNLNGSDTAIRYQLYYHDTTLIGSPLPGIGSALSFGSDTGAGAYTVVATNTRTGCTSNMAGSINISIIPIAVPSVSITASNTDTICAGQLVTFTAVPVNGGGEPSYQWAVNDTVRSSSFIYGYRPANGDVVSVRLNSDMRCAVPDSATASTTVTVHPHATPTVILSVAPGETVCTGTTVTIYATPGFGGNHPAYTWVKNAVVVSADSSYVYVPANGDNVYAVMVSDYFCLAADTTAYSNVITFTVDTPVVPRFSIIAHPGVDIGTSGMDTLIAVVINGGASPMYQWYVNGAAAANDTLPIFSGRFANNDSVSCMVTRRDACGLSAINSVRIKVGNLEVKTASQGGDITLTPNPNKGVFTVKGSLGAATGADEEVTIEITDMLGQVVYKNKTVSQNGTINEQVQIGNTLANGMYILNLRSGNGNNAIRFVIEQ